MKEGVDGDGGREETRTQQLAINWINWWSLLAAVYAPFDEMWMRGSQRNIISKRT